jgi:hypothetical protein
MLKRIITHFELFSFQYHVSFSGIFSCRFIFSIPVNSTAFPRGFFSHGLPFEINAMGAMIEPIQDGIGVM